MSQSYCWVFGGTGLMSKRSSGWWDEWQTQTGWGRAAVSGAGSEALHSPLPSGLEPHLPSGLTQLSELLRDCQSRQNHNLKRKVYFVLHDPFMMTWRAKERLHWFSAAGNRNDNVPRELRFSKLPSVAFPGLPPCRLSLTGQASFQTGVGKDKLFVLKIFSGVLQLLEKKVFMLPIKG